MPINLKPEHKAIKEYYAQLQADRDLHAKAKARLPHFSQPSCATAPGR